MNITIVRNLAGGPSESLDPGSHPKAVLLTETGKRFTIPFAPREISRDGDAGEWTQVPRPGEPPLLYRSARGLPTISFDLELVGSDFQTSVQDSIDALQALAESGERMTFSYGPSEAGLWNMTKCSLRSAERQHGTNLITEAVVSVELTRSSVPRFRVGPVSGGVATAASPTQAPTPGDQVRRHTFRPGDTLWALAQRFYGNGRLWPRIADANGIRDPKRIPVGLTVVIP